MEENDPCCGVCLLRRGGLFLKNIFVGEELAHSPTPVIISAHGFRFHEQLLQKNIFHSFACLNAAYAIIWSTLWTWAISSAKQMELLAGVVVSSWPKPAVCLLEQKLPMLYIIRGRMLTLYTSFAYATRN